MLAFLCFSKKETDMTSILESAPAVFAVGNDYSVFVRVAESSVMWLKIGDECFYDHSNGVMRSANTVHKITVPQKKLDAAKKYTVCYRRMIERKPYFSVTTEVEEIEFSFAPLPRGKFNMYQIADSHGMVEGACASARVFEERYGKIDLLVLNGDVIDHSGDVKNFDAIYDICSNITGGGIPIVFSRGNHDTRGIYAEKFEDYTPTRGGFSYFSFRLSDLWGLVIDCGEDKLDSHPEYGNTNCHEAFRREQTEYIKSLILGKESEYAADGVSRKIVFCHVPFTRRFPAPFNIEEDTYAEWASLLREDIKPDVFFAGHTHKYAIDLPGCENDAWGAPCPVVIASAPNTKDRFYAGGGAVFDENGITVVFCNQNSVTKEEKL